ncbi:PTS sugar transporter subunit IIB [Halanaerocella petrolearia]
MKIYAVCGHGLGSSMMLKINIRKVLKNLEKEAEVDTVSLSESTGLNADLFVTFPDIVTKLVEQHDRDKIVVINDFSNIEEVEEKIIQALNDLNL